MGSAEKQRRGRARVLLVFLMVLSFSTPGMSMERTDGIPDSGLSDYRLTNFHIDADIADALEGLAWVARARGGNLFALVDRKVVRAMPVKLKLREGIGLTEALAELARVYGYSCYWDLSAGAVVIGNEQSFRDYKTIETRLYDPGRFTPEEFVTALTAVVPEERLAIELAGGFLRITTGSLEHRIIGEKVSTLRSAEDEAVTFEIKVKALPADGGGIRGSLPRPPAASGLYFARLSREEQAEAALITGESPEETLSQHAVLYRNNHQFIGELLPVVVADGGEGATTVDDRKIGVTLDLTLLRKADGATLALQAEINRITDWRETEGGPPVPVITTEEAGAVVFLQEEESCVLFGPVLVAGVPGTGRTADFIRTGSPWEELLFGGGERPGEGKDLAIFINSPAGVAGYARAAEEEPTPVLPVAETPATAVAVKEEETFKEAESTVVVETQALWEAEVIELGSLGQTGRPALEPEEAEEPAALTGGEAEVAEDPKETAAGREERPAVEERSVAEERPAAEEGPGGPAAFLPGIDEVGLVITYRTKEGEELPTVAGKYGIPVETLSQMNNLSPDAALPAGIDLVVPIPVEHLYVLQPGETLWRLSRRYGVTPELLMEINQISDVTQLMIGQIIILPKPVDQAVKEN
ncbi:MAG: LysM peptidoglycan-binding domain-containing protein [Firmicutes bacterium]|nr:LysM peptidoglycan-binding domain-containing protein [Bacillota bacterium]